MEEYFIATTRQRTTRAQQRKINQAIKAIDPTADFVAADIPGNDLRGWIVRPNDGTNDYGHVKARNAEMAKVLNATLHSTT